MRKHRRGGRNPTSVPSATCLFAALFLALSGAGVQATGNEVRSYGALAMHGAPKYRPGFRHFDYVNPAAPKGGEVRLARTGSFDNLNPFILKGVAAAGINELFDTLLVRSDDEPFTRYCLIASAIELPEDRSWVAFTLRPEARFHDGSPVTADDVIASFNLLSTKGHPFYRAYYAGVLRAEKHGRHKVRFVFADGANRELPLILGELPILSKAYYTEVDFTKTTLAAPIGSGPYRVVAVDPGRSITYQRVENYWGADLAVNRGRNNFDRIRYDYYRDITIAVEALKAGEYDFRAERSAKSWATGYQSPAVARGLLKKVLIPHRRPTGMQGFLFNTRRSIFRDRRTRAALVYAFDFEWSNKTLFYDAYARTASYFSNSELAAVGLPGPGELEILEPFRGRIPDEVFTTAYAPPRTDGSGRIRGQLRKAKRLLKSAGWRIKDGRLIHRSNGQQMRFEILLVEPAFERATLPLVRNLARLGIEVRVRTVDTAQYRNRLDSFDFDMVVASYPQSSSPGNEQRDYWGSDKANIRGSRNLIGIEDPVVDALIERVIAAPDRASLIDRTRALDRVLLWGHYLIPHWHLQAYRVAFWDKFGRPDKVPKYGLAFDTWWIDGAKEEALRRGLVTAHER